jgi:hypothetical protein
MHGGLLPMSWYDFFFINWYCDICTSYNEKVIKVRSVQRTIRSDLSVENEVRV